MIDKPKGIIDPPLDDLLEKVENKYQLVIFASKRARQINDYYTDLQDGAIYNNVGPLVDSNVDDKPLSIALREINDNKLVMREPQEEAIILDDDASEDLLDFGEDTVSPTEAE
ncbi:DNA-directed RNA polymerase subunit omega [Gulosibacter molinativorax]|uniref:DNA-directed RNA polymerase subunit omega n=1 Tax=Gulosibacter molinativorax TaxID=256821 RepID=A0ABT7C8V5_9MICO|nr:DNA-directed RNA polymerase subunit omega [Gulosibacter molinativorax]MDJ1371071.1 DNA-directed RNA polymerase subunit omega [Gulosibacter molinativorax]QUY61431.1 DNA-directed RNA polymerase subunit omega [Gulosibacter molinativorax]